MNPTPVLSLRRFAAALLLGLLIVPVRGLPTSSPPAELLISEVRYEGQLSDTEARFAATIVGEVLGKGETSALLFEGDLAVPPVQLPSHLRLARQGNQYRLVATRPGRFEFSVTVIAKISKADPWNQTTFTGPAAGLASLAVSAAEGVEVQFVSGARVPDTLGGSVQGQRRLRAVLGADQVVALRLAGPAGRRDAPDAGDLRNHRRRPSDAHGDQVPDAISVRDPTRQNGPSAGGHPGQPDVDQGRG